MIHVVRRVQSHVQGKETHIARVRCLAVEEDAQIADGVIVAGFPDVPQASDSASHTLWVARIQVERTEPFGHRLAVLALELSVHALPAMLQLLVMSLFREKHWRGQEAPFGL